MSFDVKLPGSDGMCDASAPNMQPGNGYRLPPEAYFDSRWLEHEREKLFPDTWVFACTVDELDRVGSYRSLRVGHSPIAVLRDREDQIRAFHNVCRHRGARMLADEGHCTRIICPYHSWMYALGGRLLSAPQAETELPDMEPSEWGLRPVPVGVWMGMIFVNAGGKAPPFDTWIAPVRDYLDVYRADELTSIGQAEFVFEAGDKAFKLAFRRLRYVAFSQKAPKWARSGMSRPSKRPGDRARELAESRHG